MKFSHLGMAMFPLRANDHVTTPRPSLRSPLLSGRPQLSKKLPEPTDYCYHPLLPLPEVKVKSLLLKTPCVSDTGSRGPRARADLKASCESQLAWYQKFTVLAKDLISGFSIHMAVHKLLEIQCLPLPFVGTAHVCIDTIYIHMYTHTKTKL